MTFQLLITSFVTENLHLAGNVPSGTNIPLSSVSIPSQRLYRGPIHCISSILQTEGLQGLYRGAGAMILRDVPGYMLYFIPYTIFCNLMKPDTKSSPHPCSIWLAGGLAGKCPALSHHLSTVQCLISTVLNLRLQLWPWFYGGGSLIERHFRVRPFLQFIVCSGFAFANTN